MRRKILATSLMVLMLCCFPTCMSVSALEYGEVAEQYEQMLDGISPELAEQLPDGLFSEDLQEIYGAAEQMTSFDYVWGRVIDYVSGGLDDAARLLVSLMGLLVLCALMKTVKSFLRSPSLASALGFCTTGASVTAIIALQYGRLGCVTEYLGALNLFATSTIPLMGVLYAMGGNVAGAAVSNSSMMLFLAVCENVCNRTVIPVTSLCICLAVAAALSPTVDMKGIAGAVKKGFSMLLGFVMTLLLAMLSAQSTLAAASDNMAARTAKYMAGSFIPVVGGAVGDTLKTVAAGIRFIRSSAGVAGIVIIILMLLPPLISVAVTRLVFMLSSTAARLLGCSDEAGLLGELTSIYGYLMAVICACSVMFIFALTLMAHTGVAMGG